MATDIRQKVLKYYSRILSYTNNDYEPSRLENYVKSMSDQEVERAYQKLVMAGITKLPFMALGPIGMAAAVPASLMEMVITAQAILKCIGDYDYSKSITEEINGNIFSYEKEFPIEEYRQELYDIGNDVKGDKYSVYLQDGELVVY